MFPPTYLPDFHDKESVQKLKYRQIGATDILASSLSFGASSLGGVFRTTDDAESVSLVQDVVKKGINYIDTAPWYGQGRSEEVLGKALKTIPRKSFYIATKVGRYELNAGEMFDFTREKTLTSVQNSLNRLGVDTIDIIQVHDIEFCHNLKQIVDYTIPALLELKAAGKVRYIGITGYSLDTIMRLIDLLPPGTVDTVLTYCRATLIDQTLLGHPLDWFKSRNIGVINASPVSMGLLSNRGPPTWHPATTHIKEASKEAAKYVADQGEDITDIAVLWTLALENIPTTLISTASVVNMTRNLRLAQSAITPTQASLAKMVIEKYFSSLTVVHWENIDVNNYWTQLEQAGLKQNTDL